MTFCHLTMVCKDSSFLRVNAVTLGLSPILHFVFSFIKDPTQVLIFSLYYYYIVIVTICQGVIFGFFESELNGINPSDWLNS